MKKLVLIASVCLLLTSCQKDFGKLKVVQDLSNLLIEVSGTTTLPNSDLVWMINDSANGNLVFGLRVSGEIEREITITNADNDDWEDLASDAEGNLYIGNFGNNRGVEKKPSIYKVSGIATSKKSKFEAVKTEFYFEDQKEFPPEGDYRNFDAEAFIILNNYFYIFTKNRSKEFGGGTKLYRVPAKEGSFKAKLLDTYKTCSDNKTCLVTSACISKDQKTIVLLTSSKVFVLTNFEGDNFFKGDIEELDLGHWSQKEGITFKNDSTLYMTDERRGYSGNNLYEFILK